jgi:ABC-type transporter Mla maintaining outer membrane lipid asymmetry permease subunit MlaE
MRIEGFFSSKSRSLWSSLLTSLGRKALGLIDEMGAMVIFFSKAFLLIFRSKRPPMIAEHVYHVGARSATIVTLVGLFTGMAEGTAAAENIDYVFSEARGRQQEVTRVHCERGRT